MVNAALPSTSASHFVIRNSATVPTMCLECTRRSSLTSYQGSTVAQPTINIEGAASGRLHKEGQRADRPYVPQVCQPREKDPQTIVTLKTPLVHHTIFPPIFLQSEMKGRQALLEGRNRCDHDEPSRYRVIDEARVPRSILTPFSPLLLSATPESARSTRDTRQRLDKAETRDTASLLFYSSFPLLFLLLFFVTVLLPASRVIGGIASTRVERIVKIYGPIKARRRSR